MREVLSFLVSAVSSLYTDMEVNKVNLKKRLVREDVFKKLVSVIIACYTLVHRLGYSDNDVVKAIAQASEAGTDGGK